AGERRWARVRLARPLPIWRGQVLILRLASPAHTIGAVTVARPGASRGSLHLDDSRLAQLLSDDPADVLLSLLQEGPASAAKLAMLSSLPDATVSTCLADLAAAGRLEPLGDRYVLPAMAEEIRRRALEHLAQFHERQPLRPGMAPEQLRRELRLDVDGFAAVVSTLRARGALSILHTSVAPGTSAATRDVVLALTEHARGERAAALKGDVEAAVRAVESARFMPPSGKDLRDSYKLDQETLRYLCRTGRFVRLTSDFFMATGTYHEMVDRVTGAILARGRITVAEIRDLLGVSRKYALAFGDHLDSEHITRRVGDERVLTSRFHARGG
ncbi:MAG TPA: SelB C-terminal domain-containing protein, partial [Chloroflexota bacterium]|nr:SelB C-terminal domain-containing protein [Chloroflexota bacterium]